MTLVLPNRVIVQSALTLGLLAREEQRKRDTAEAKQFVWDAALEAGINLFRRTNIHLVTISPVISSTILENE